MIDVADLYNLSSKPDENENIFIDDIASIQLAIFLENAAEAASLTAPEEGEIIINKGIATFTFQTFLDDLAA